MSGPPTDLPPRLLAADATDFERRVLEGALQKKPSAAASARMARALGVTAGLVGTTATAGAATTAGKAAAATTPGKAAAATTAGKTAAATAAGKTAAATAAGATWPWISAGVVTLGLVGAVVGPRILRAPVPQRIAARAPAPPPPESAPTAGELARPAPGIAEGSLGAVSPTRRAHLPAATSAGELRDEIGFIDGARAALSDGDGGRALDVVRRYMDRYPSGTFRPEATAIRIEALLKLGRRAEARALAARFVAEQRGSLLAARVAELVGLDQPAP